MVNSRAMRRRQFLVISAASIGGVLVYSLDRKGFRLAAQDRPAGSLRIPLRFFTEREALIVAAAASRIFPSDDTGPGAREAGVAIYIDLRVRTAETATATHTDHSKRTRPGNSDTRVKQRRRKFTAKG